ESCMHIGIRGPLYGNAHLEDDEVLGFQSLRGDEYQFGSVADVVARMRSRLGDAAGDLAVDIDVLDPAAAPGTGTPEAGGMTSRELLNSIRGLQGLNVVGAELVEVAPAYDHAEITGLAAAHVGYEILSLWAAETNGSAEPTGPAGDALGGRR